MTIPSDLQALIDAHHLTPYADSIMQDVKPAVGLARTLMDDGAILIGASKLGGAPDLPADVVWPEWDGKPLTFMAQINLTELDLSPFNELLPSTGVLAFFYESTSQPWGDTPPEGAARVIYSNDSSTPLQRRQHPVMEIDKWYTVKALPAARITPKPIWTCRCYDYPDNPPYLSETQSENYNRLYSSVYAAIQPKHMMLGHAYPQQTDVRIYAQALLWRFNHPSTKVDYDAAKAAMGQWVTLLQIDTDDDLGMMWGDVGLIYYMFREQDLRALKFDQHWLVLQCG